MRSFFLDVSRRRRRGQGTRATYVAFCAPLAFDGGGAGAQRVRLLRVPRHSGRGRGRTTRLSLDFCHVEARGQVFRSSLS